ncbi:hypothetical protein G9A89_001304 [Geosiphon pyriformis]|nr:hypothetical protein G9A89_001304 [Geosiphon pyriformis]
MTNIYLLIFLLFFIPLVLGRISREQEIVYIKVEHKTVNLVSASDSDDELRLISTNDEEPAKWMTQKEVQYLLWKGIKFMDITDAQDLGTTVKFTKSHQYPAVPIYREEVLPFLGELTTKTMEINLKKFTSFRNRYYRSEHGLNSSNWLFKEIQRIIRGAKKIDNVKVKKFNHQWKQFSIIARFEGSDSRKKNEVIIISAHQDSINMYMPSNGRAPGADDDGSGTISILEAFRVLVKGGFKPDRAVEFHWYSAEEVGLLGSQVVAREYERKGKDVIAVLQNDMTGYVGRKRETIGIVLDFVDSNLTIFTKALIEEYTAISWTDTKCGYACSDHASWRKAGFPSACTTEGPLEDTSPYIHTTGDTIDTINFNHMLEFSKLAVGFAIELSHL